MATNRHEALYRLAEAEAPSFAAAIARAAAHSRNEREFQTAATRCFDDFAKKADVELVLREEYTLARGRADAVYNRLIVEYEKPGSMRLSLDHPQTRHALNQVREYIEDVSTRERHDKNRLLGVAWDGKIVVFARYRDGHWHVDPPLEVNEHSVARLLRSLVSLASGRALIPENLVEDFGARNEISQKAAHAFYHALENHEDDLTSKLYRQWQLLFGEVTGYEEATVRLGDRAELRSFASGMGLEPETTDPPRLLFAVHTYFSFLVKAIARLVLERHAAGHLGTTPLTVLANLQGESLRQELQHLEDGGVFHALGLVNLLEGDFFSWYVHSWRPEVEQALHLTISRLAEYNPATIEEDPYAARDLLKKLYHYLLPRDLRHDLGEYYTPDWLAERVLTQLNEPILRIPRSEAPPADLFPARRVLDPACGSGTFLVLAIRSMKQHCARHGLGETETLEYILANVVGIDLNPLAVMAARVNYLLAVSDLIPYRRGPVSIPVFLADSIVRPVEGETLFDRGRCPLKTVVGTLPIPQAITTAAAMAGLTGLLEECISSRATVDAFLERASRELLIDSATRDGAVLAELYGKLTDLEERHLDGIWARVLKNAFMPLFMGRFKYVVGNPPWVNWTNLPEAYRDDTEALWRKYDLFPHKGLRARLGGSQDDISVLMTYVALDQYLEPSGTLAFVITQSLFKSYGGGKGFRRFALPRETPIQVVHVDDMAELQPFEGATNRTSIVMLRKGLPTRYPVPYTVWRKRRRGALSFEASLDDATGLTQRLRHVAEPIDSKDLTSPWISGRRSALSALQKVKGGSTYRARKGITPDVNAVYWVQPQQRLPGGMVVATNGASRARRQVQAGVWQLEASLIYPLLLGRDVRRWVATPSEHVLLPQDPEVPSRALSEDTLSKHYPKAFAYFRTHEDVLRARRSQIDQQMMSSGPFYSVYGVGPYTFSSFKVVWREVASKFLCAAVGPWNDELLGLKPVVPDHKLILVDLASWEEAAYVSGLLNSSPVQLLVTSYSVMTQVGTHVLEYVAIPAYNPALDLHAQIAHLSTEAHMAAAKEMESNSWDRQARLDELAARLWGLTPDELSAIHRNLAEIGGEMEAPATDEAASTETE